MNKSFEKSHINVILRRLPARSRCFVSAKAGGATNLPAQRVESSTIGQAGNLAFLPKEKNKILPLRYAQCQNDKRQTLFKLLLNNIFIFCTLFFFIGCGSSVNIPSTEESQQKIAEIKPRLDSLIERINQQTTTLPGGHDLISRTRISAINTLLARVANRTLADIHINFLPTRPLWKEEKTVFGISYTNFVDVDTGALKIDLKKFLFTSFSNNIINAQIEIEGTGSIGVSGKYTGVTARSTSQVRFYLDEDIQFSVSAADSDYIKLVPTPKTVILKSKVTISLLGWNIPYYKEIPLQATDLVKPVLIPSALRSEIIFPLPAAQYGSQRLEFVKRYLRFSKSSVRANDNGLEYRSNIDFEKE